MILWLSAHKTGQQCRSRHQVVPQSLFQPLEIHVVLSLSPEAGIISGRYEDDFESSTAELSGDEHAERREEEREADGEREGSTAELESPASDGEDLVEELAVSLQYLSSLRRSLEEDETICPSLTASDSQVGCRLLCSQVSCTS